MFGIFNKKKQTDKVKAAIETANAVACDFSDLIASGSIEPTLIYDVSALPHAKDLIEKSCKLWILACPDVSQRQSWKVVLPMLSQFQEGVGSIPLGLDVSTLVNQGLPPQELARKITSLKMPSAELLERVHAEEHALLSWVTHAVDRCA
ncbi:hypothetical protein W02_06140 [Nitrospira sp. KM1]|uniref:hypothetical protein n=1 Tax=Nitrospira sp. KM1 TaxID=1936990 RepID=UPI0013A74FF7|nr:hypothetical protein [Nitrospira sp. KM1]BCA53474.1 hypothetical protein W02_06140 [Nitrospira sp. KM1]